MTTPLSNEYTPFYAKYVAQTAHLSIQAALQADVAELRNIFSSLTDARGNYAYAEGKWSIKEVLLHCIDAERVFAYRALRLLRGDRTPLPGYDQDPFVPASSAKDRSVQSIHNEWEAVRSSTMALYNNAPMTNLRMIGEASGHPISARALAYIIPGHYLHHVAILKERYEWAV